MLFDWIFFGLVGLFGTVAFSLVAGFIFAVAFELLSIAVEETFNLLFDIASLIVCTTRYVISPRGAADNNAGKGSPVGEPPPLSGSQQGG